MSTNTPTQKRESKNWRFGHDFTYDNIRYAWRRQPYANKLVVGTVDDAIGKGFDIIDVATKKPVEKNDEIIQLIKTMWPDLKKTCYYDRAYGKGLGMFFLEEGMVVPMFRSYDTRNYYADYDEFARPTMYMITNNVGGISAKSEVREVIDEELDFTYEIITREDVVKREGISVLESVWDTLFALASLDEQGTYYAIRYGSGIRYMKIPQSKFTDKAFMAKIMSMLKGAIGANGVYALPYQMVNGIKEDFDIASENAVQIDFTQLENLLLSSLAAQTGIPLEVWKGSLLGLRSSEKNEDRYFDYLQGIQDDYREFFKWVVLRLNTLFNWFGNTTIIDIKYVERDTQSAEEKVEEIGIKVDIAGKAGFNVPKDWLEENLGIPLEEKEIDPLGINEAIQTDDEATA
jgi:hypothetical protein